MKHPELLDIYSDYLLSSFSLVTAVGLSALLDQGYSHDQISRFLAQGKFTQKDFWRMVKRLIRRIEQDQGVLSIDDTIAEKAHSTENDMICYHWDHAKGRSVKGINIINFLYHASLANGQHITLPTAFEIVEKTERYLDKKTDKIKRRSPVTKNEIVRERLRILVQYNRLKFRYVVWDTWFSSKENLSFVHYTLKRHFVCALKDNRLVALSEQAKRQGQWTQVGQLELQTNQPIKVWLKGLDFPILMIKRRYENQDGSAGVLYLISNDYSLTNDQLFTIYDKRWSVEVFHKSLKQNVGLTKSPTKYEITQANHIFAAMIAYCKLELLKLKQHTNQFALKSKLYLKAVQAAYQELRRLKHWNAQLPPELQTTIPLLG